MESVHEDTEVRVHEIEKPSPWGLDRLDQPSLPLNGEFDYYNLGTNVNVYIVDTVRRLSVSSYDRGCPANGC